MRNLYMTALLLLLASHASADSLTDQLRGCAAIKQDSERLACYDALSGSLEKRAKQNFGREQAQISEEAPDSISVKIAAIEPGAYGKLIITLDNGQVWRQNDSVRVHWDSGDQVQVERGALGSFFMRLEDGGRKIRVKRIK